MILKKGTWAVGWKENNQKHQLTRDALGLSLRVNDTLKTLSEPDKKGFESFLKRRVICLLASPINYLVNFPKMLQFHQTP